MLQCVAVCCSVLQCVAVCCSVLQCVVGSTVCDIDFSRTTPAVRVCVRESERGRASERDSLSVYPSVCEIERERQSIFLSVCAWWDVQKRCNLFKRSM